MLDPALIQRIRAIFLHHEPRVTIAEAADMLGCLRAEMNAAIRNGEIEVIETCSGKRIELRELAAYAASVAADSDRRGARERCDADPAAGAADAEAHLSPAALSVLADDGRESVDAMLTRTFEELTDLNQERLSRVIPGLGEAIAWPEAGESDRPC